MEPGMQLAQYRIVRRIGAGGMAEVFLAQKTGAAGFSRQVAIKTIIAAGAAQESIGLFLDEARVASNLQHANIVQTLDLGFENDTLFIAMEYVPGPPLSRVIKELKDRGEFMPPTMIAYIGAKVANALDFAHRRVTTAQGQTLNLVHRDISPQNILVSRTGIIKLMDFGVARASIQMHKTRTGQVRGKAAYMAPEQVRAQALDGRTDMFALGLVLYEMLSAYRPFQRQNEIASMRAIIGEDVPPLSDRNPDVPPALEAVVMRCLRRAPDERYAHCGELEAALLHTVRNERLAQMDEQIVALLERLFGEEKFADEMPEVEAWQPTMASVDTPHSPRLKLPKSELSPTIAAMLGQTPQTPQPPVIAPMPEPLMQSGPQARGFTQAPQRSMPPGGFAPGAPGQGGLPPPVPPGTPPHAVAYDPSTGILYDAQGQPIEGVNMGTPERAFTPGSLASGSAVSGSNLRIPLSSNGQMQGMLSGTASALSPYSLSSMQGMTPASSPSIVTTTSSNLKLVVAVLASFLAGICLMVLLRDGDGGGARSHPLPSSHPSPTLPGARAVPASAAPALITQQAPSPTPQEAAPPEAPQPSPRDTPRETPRESPREVARERPRESGRPRSTPVAEAPAATEAPQPALDRAKITERALALKSRASAAGQNELAGKLGSLVNDMLVGRDPTPADAELVRSAEKSLP